MRNKINNNLVHEIYYSRVWEDTKKGIDWIQDLPGISPGYASIGYNYLYIMTRVLNEARPKFVLDIGMGNSTVLISQYFKYLKDKNSEHTIIEHDESWVKFFNYSLPENSKICLCNLIQKNHAGRKFNAYENFDKVVCNKKYNVISVDGPVGSPKYSRRDILDCVPDILADNGIIIFDDAERKGEQRTISDLEILLKRNNIYYQKRIYNGEKQVCVIGTSNSWHFCSL